MSGSHLVESEVTTISEKGKEELEDVLVRNNSLQNAIGTEHGEQEKQYETRMGRGPCQLRKPGPEVLSLEDRKLEGFKNFGDDGEHNPGEDSDADGKEGKIPARKKGRPRVKLMQLPVEKKKRGRPRVNPVQPLVEKKKLGRPKSGIIYTCNLCGKFFKYPGLLKRHEQAHFGIKEFECEYCHKRFGHKGGLTAHLRRHTGERPYKCSYCPTSFRNRTSLDCHIFKHTKQGTKCPQCPLVFATPAVVKQHIREVHTTEKPHVCQICGKSYKHRQSLTYHLKDHDERICTVCGKLFTTMSALKGHRHIHELNQKCNYCDRSFKSEEELQAHCKLRGRVYQCEMCCYSFNKAEFLINHNRRDHWKMLGLERLPRKFVPRNRKSKSEGPKVKNSKEKPRIAQIGDLPVKGTVETRTGVQNNQNPPSAEYFTLPVPLPAEANQHPMPMVDQQNQPVPPESLVKPKLLAPIVSADTESVLPKTELKISTEHAANTEEEVRQTQSDSDQDLSDHLDNVGDYKNETVEADCEPKVKVKVEPSGQAEHSVAAPPLEAGDFVKVEITKTDKPVENQDNNTPAAKEDPIESKPEDLKKRKQDLSDSDDDEVPLAILRLTPRQRRPTTKSVSGKKKNIYLDRKKKPRAMGTEDSSDDDGRLLSICGSSNSSPSDSSDSPQSSTSEDDNTKAEKPKMKRKRRRKQDDEGSRKRPYQKRNMTCPICGEVFKGRVTLKEHKKSAHPDAKANVRPVICELCGKSYATSSSLAVHRGQHEEYQRFKCDECPKAFIFQCFLESHKRREHRRERLICPLCGKQYKYGSDLKHHLLRHEEEKPFKCEECPAAFRHSSNLQIHKATHKKKVFACTICNKNFQYANSLRVHKRLHSGVKHFRCEICDREFSQKAPLMRHMAIHSVDRQVKCVVCDKVYYKKVDLLIHQAKEHPNHPLIGKTIKVHTCNVCGMEYTKESLLKIHSDIHENEYRFKCDMCEGQKFKQKAGLRYHWKHFHQMEPPKRNLGKKLEEKKTEKPEFCAMRSATVKTDFRSMSFITDSGS